MKRREFLNGFNTFLAGIVLPRLSFSKLIKKEHRMKTYLHKANTRGVAEHGWLNSHHTFSFANYYNPERMGFGALRVINDDIVAPSKGFGTHPHQNMEIISVPLKGSLKHKDTMGNEHVINKGEVQAMSAGSGLQHSEYNNSDEEEANFLQIWIQPKKYNIKPNYSQKEFPVSNRSNKPQLIVSPDGREESVEINQDAFFSLVKLSKGNKLTYSKFLKENGVYFFVLDGSFTINGQELELRDGFGLEGIEDVEISSESSGEVLIMEVPMNINGKV